MCKGKEFLVVRNRFEVHQACHGCFDERAIDDRRFRKLRILEARLDDRDELRNGFERFLCHQSGDGELLPCKGLIQAWPRFEAPIHRALPNGHGGVLAKIRYLRLHVHTIEKFVPFALRQFLGELVK